MTIVPASGTIPANTTIVPASGTIPANTTTVPASEAIPANVTIVPASETIPANTTIVPANRTIVPTSGTIIPAGEFSGTVESDSEIPPISESVTVTDTPPSLLSDDKIRVIKRKSCSRKNFATRLNREILPVKDQMLGESWER